MNFLSVKKTKKVLFLLLCAAISFSRSLAAEVSPEPPVVLFQFSGEIKNAKVFLTQTSDRSREPAQWTGKYFDFGNLGEAHRIGTHPGIFEQKQVTAIYLQPFKESRKTLQFSQVPPGGTLAFYYGIQDSDIELKESKESNYFYVRIWAGKKLLQRVRVARELGWKRIDIPLGVVSLLTNPIMLSFDVVSDAEPCPALFFDAAIIK
ncbi:MAG: hypothetical protein EXS63_03335 [Candidatus Omnitrophica bacterium]|nr:hypothetical protein [Candidatus Omnitrophota bacterium]